MVGTTHQSRSAGVTFAVDAVEPATQPLELTKTHKALALLLEGGPRVESCCDYSDDVVANVGYHPLLASVFLAFSQHRPLVLSPDAVWITIAQGVAHHMALHGERLRTRLVAHQGRLKLTVTVNDWVEGSPENPWPRAFEAWTSLIADHVGPALYNTLVCDFSTTGPVERAASHVVMMDIFERYFHYDLLCICGIPTVTLEGAAADWERLRAKVRKLRVFELDWWIDHLLPICDQFVRAAGGDVDLPHWQNICKLRDEYGGEIFNGWIAKLFLYVREWVNGPTRRKNPIFETGEGFQGLVAPTGLSSVPFTRRNLRGDVQDMEAIGGLVGVTQDTTTHALRARAGWAVRAVDMLHASIARLQREHTTRPGMAELMVDPRSRRHSDMPEELERFYYLTDGADVFASVNSGGGEPLYRIVRMNELAQPLSGTWHRLCRVRGSAAVLAVNFDGKTVRDSNGASGYKRLHPVCLLPDGGKHVAPTRIVVAESLGELLKRMLDAGADQPFWLRDEFKDYGPIGRWRERA